MRSIRCCLNLFLPLLRGGSRWPSIRSSRTRSVWLRSGVGGIESLEPRLLLTYSTLIDKGPSDNRVDIVFLGDGYTASEIDTNYVDHINAMLDHTFHELEDPYPRYENYFNVHRINTVSNESGADKPPEGIFVDTAFDAYYYCGNIERLLCVSTAKVGAELATELSGAPFTAEVKIVTVNDTKYGGSGGTYAVYAGGNSAATEVALHELAHSFNRLADEYFSPGTYTGGEPGEPNVTKSATGDKWSHWIGYDQPGIGVIGAYEGARYFQNGLYRPSNNSKMRSLGVPFDAVSREKIILDIYDLVDPLDDWRDNSAEIAEVGPELWVDAIDPAVIQVEWSVDGQLVAGASGETFRPADFGFTAPYSVTARAFDPTDWVRIQLSKLEQSVTWQVVPSGPDLVATAFNAVSDHVVNGQTDVTFSITNLGDSDAGSFDTQIVWSPNGIVGDADDVVVAGSVVNIAGLTVGAVDTRTISVQLDQAALYDHAIASTPAGQPVGTTSLETSHLFLVIDIGNDVAEANENNNSGQGQLIDSDDITYFPWDKNGDGTVTPLEALSTIQSIGTTDAASDLDGNGIVTPLEALSAIQRIGYVRNSSVVGDNPLLELPVVAEAELQDAHMAPASSRPIRAVAVAPEIKSARPQESADVPRLPDTSEPRFAAVPDDDDRNKHFFIVDDDSQHSQPILIVDDFVAVDEHFPEVPDWHGIL